MKEPYVYSDSTLRKIEANVMLPSLHQGVIRWHFLSQPARCAFKV
jgi:hypothetical protein